jgi:hypothetical protein
LAIGKQLEHAIQCSTKAQGILLLYGGKHRRGETIIASSSQDNSVIVSPKGPTVEKKENDAQEKEDKTCASPASNRRLVQALLLKRIADKLVTDLQKKMTKNNDDVSDDDVSDDDVNDDDVNGISAQPETQKQQETERHLLIIIRTGTQILAQGGRR